MSYRLYVRPIPPFADADHDPGAQLFNWLLHDASGDVQARGAGESRDAIEQTLGQNALDHVLLIGLVPGEVAIYCLADIPARQSRFISQALPYAVEEQIAQDIDSVHLALGSRTEQGYPVAAIDREHMRQWAQMFSGWAHVRLEAIYPDASLLPRTDGGWCICLDGDTAMLVSARGEWLSMQAANLGMFGHTLAAPSGDDVVADIPVTVYGTEDELNRQQPVLSELAGSGRLSVRSELLELMPLELLAHAHYHHLCSPVNLCQGVFSAKTGKASPLKPWRPLIAVAAVWFGVQIALNTGMGFYYQNQAQELTGEAMALYRDAFPGDRRTQAGNVRRVVEGQLRVAGSNEPEMDFLTLMKYTGQQYDRLPGSQSVDFNSVNYSRTRGELVVDVRADSYDRLSALRNGLAQQGLEVQIGSVVNEASGARGRLTVSGG